MYELNHLRNISDSFKKIVIVNGIKKPWRNDEVFSVEATLKKLVLEVIKLNSHKLSENNCKIK